MEKEHKSIHLRTKFTLASLVLCIAICAALLYIAYSHFSTAMHTMYEERLRGVVRTAAAYIPKEKLHTYYDGLASKGDAQARMDEEYLEIREQFRILSRENNLDFLYSYRPEPDGLRVFVQGTEDDDPYNYVLGDFLTVGVDYSQEHIDMANALITDPNAPKVYVTESKYGIHHRQ